MKLPFKPIPALTKEEVKKEHPFKTHEIFITQKQVDGFERLLKANASEKTIDSFLTKNPEIFTAALHEFHTGHHGAIVIPKQAVRPKIKSSYEDGLIPDFIVGGDSSDGWRWWIIEIKGANQKIFADTTGRPHFSNELNKGITQLLEYIDFCSEQQGMLRDSFKLENFREPKGMILAGREDEFLDEKRKRLKAAWNRVAANKLEIRTYDFVLRNLQSMFHHHNKKK